MILRSLIVLGGAALAWLLIDGWGGGSPQGDGNDAMVAVSDGRWERIRDRVPGARGLQNMVPVVAGDRVVVIAGVDYDQAVVKGFLFDPEAHRWSRASPSGLWWRFGQSVVAAGDKAILWGGCCGGGGRGSQAPGAIYDVATDRWRTLEPGPLGNRYHHTAVWTGEEMIVWGGVSPSGVNAPVEDVHADGAAFDPRRERWRAIAPAPLAPRRGHVAVWTGEEMIVWGGARLLRPIRKERERLLYDGAAYDPERDRWRWLAPARIARPPTSIAVEEVQPHAFWTREAMIVWTPYGGALYEPRSDTWERIPPPPPEIRKFRREGSAVWTGERLIVWGGDVGPFVTEGAAYDPETRRWAALPEGPIAGRAGHVAVWTRKGMLIYGGCCQGASARAHADGAIYVPR